MMGLGSPSENLSQSGYAYEDFLAQELEALKRRLLDKHQEEVGRGMNELHGDNEALLSPTSRQAKAAQRWAELTASLLDKNVATNGSTDVEKVSRPLELRSAWQFSRAEAYRAGRNRTHAGTDALRFNDTYQDESCLQRFVVGPESQVQFVWAMMATCFIIWDTATIPVEMFPVDRIFGQVITVVAVISSVFWIVDVPLHFLFGVQTGGAIELRPLQLAKLYMRSWLLADILIILIDVTLLSFQAFASDVNPAFRSGRFLRTLRLIRLVRLLRVGKLERQVMKIANRFLSTYSLMALRVAGYLAIMLAMNHLIACCWYGVGAWTQHLGNWLDRSAIDPESVSEAYIASLHWSLTQFTPSTNPIAPGNAWERFYAIWVILLAMACFSSFIGSIGTTLTSMRSVRREQLLQETKLEVFFTERNLSLDLFERVKGALQQDKMARTRLHEQEVVLIQGIPERIKVQLHKEMFLRILFQLEIWPVWTRNDMDFLQHLCHHTMSEHTSRPGQDIFMPRTECFLVYVLETGSLEYFVQGQQPVHCTETSNAVLCLPSLWAEWHHVGHLTATFGTCFYVGIDCQKFCTLAATFGGPLCEYLKVLGILLLGQIEAAQGMNLVITDISVTTDINVRELSERAEGFTSLREHFLNHSDSQVRSETRESFESISEDAVETRERV